MPGKSSDPNSVRINRTLANRAPTRYEFPPLKVPKAFQGFINFVREQGVVGLGVGFVVGSSANTLVHSAVTNLLNPFIGIFTGGSSLGQKTVCLKSVGSVCKNPLNYGIFLSDFITFLIILVVVYVVIKALRLDSLTKKQ